MSSAIQKLWGLLKLHRAEVTAIYFYAMMSSLIQLSLPLGIQAIIGFVMGAAMVTSIYVLIMIIVAGVLLVGIMQIKQMQNVEKIQQKLFVQYAFEFAERIPRVDLTTIDHYYLPEKVNRFFDVVTLQKSLSKVLLELPIAGIQILLGFLLLAVYHPLFLFFSLILLIVVFVVVKYTSSRGFYTSIEESNQKYETVSWIEEMARVAKSFKLSQGSHFNLTRTDQNVMKYLRARTEHFSLLSFQFKSLVAVKVLLSLLMLSLGSYLLLEQKINIGEFIAAEIVILTLIGASEKIITNIDSVYDVMTAIEKLDTVANLETEKSGTLDIDTERGIAVTFKELGFTYGNGTSALKDIEQHIPAYSKVCISGKAGSGKTTLLRILSGNYTGYSGQYLLNGLPAISYALEKLRSHLGKYINQYDLFKGTVWENISLNRPGVTPQQVLKLMQDIGFEHTLSQLPNGFDTPIDSHGKRLSSAMAKKILLLRAMCNQPSLLLLEEPWEGLGEHEKEKLIHYLLHILKRSTLFVISNDQEFAAQCDLQIRLEQGKIRHHEK